MIGKKMYEELPSFYQSHMHEKEIVEKVFESYTEAMDIPTSYALRVSNMMTLSGSEIFRVTDSFKISSVEGIYEVSELARSPMAAFPKELITSEEKMQFFLAASLDDRLNILKSTGHYISLAVTGYEGQRTQRIIGFEAYSKSGKRLSYAAEYIVADNVLYLFGKAAEKNPDNYELVLKNILIDLNSIEERLGMFLNMPYNPILSKAEYRDLSLTFIEAAMGGPSLANIDKTMKAMFGDTFSVYDAYSADNDKKDYWDSGALSPFDFIINIPLEYSINEDRLNLFYDYLSIIKPPESSFFVNWGLVIGGEQDSAKIKDSVLHEISHPEKTDNIGTLADSFKIKPKMPAEVDRVSVSSVDRFDMSKFSLFDSGLFFDKPVTSNAEGRNEILEICSVRHITYPEMPTSRTISKLGNRVNVRFAHSDILNLQYRIYKNEVLVKTINSSGLSKGHLIDYFEDLTPGTYKFSVRSVGYPSATDATLERLSVPAVLSIVIS